MPYTRRDIWKLAADDKTLELYGKAVEVLRKRPLTAPNSWRYLAAIHGANEQTWADAGYLDDGSSFPNPLPSSPAWDQCQHQSWFFLPWHRGYLAAFEAIVRDVIANELGGPSDWVLPYWDYNDTENPHRLEMPPAFASPTLPDGSKNWLYVERRYGEAAGPIVLDDGRINFRPAMLSSRFVGVDSGASSGFGGPSTPFHHGGGTGGLLEREPHNNVHTMIGGGIRDENGAIIFGLMSRPNTAALDPIFWIHHANIDRLWEVWLQRNIAINKNPADPDWLEGPVDIAFTMPGVDGTNHQFFPADMIDTTAPHLNYAYESTEDPFPGQTRIRSRLMALNAALPPFTPAASTAPMSPKVELVGTYSEPLKLGAGPVSADVPLDSATHRKTLQSLGTNLSLRTSGEPDRLFVNIQNIRGKNDAAAFYVYVNLPEGADPKAHLDRRASAISLFGVEEASRSDGKHSGNGLNEIVEITDIVDKLHAEGALGEDGIRITLVPANDIQSQDDISIGGISIYRQGE